MKNPITLTIGIPAYNEGANIAQLLRSLVDQRLDDMVITKIYVVSDASVDMTVKKATEIKDSRIIVKNNIQRMGKTAILNRLFTQVNTDFLIILDADVKITDRNFILKLITASSKISKVGIIGSKTVSLSGRSYFEKIIAESHALKNDIYSRAKDGDSVYLCHGRSRAFHKSLYKKMYIPDDVPEDAYTYLFAKKQGFTFTYAPKSKVYFRSPTNLADHIRQSFRFHDGQKALCKYFDPKFVRKSYSLSLVDSITVGCIYLVKNPLKTILYCAFAIYARLSIDSNQVHHSLWSIATSSKKLS